ncbi:MAG: hypothetical protein V3U92_17270 [Cellulophaga sp.]
MLRQKEILQTILDANPNHFSDWDLPNTEDLGTLSGITKDVEGNNILELDLEFKGIANIPSEIGDLTSLTHLGLGVNNITSIPIEIGNLIDLIELDLIHNKLTSLFF